jgi:hypothetical protein
VQARRNVLMRPRLGYWLFAGAWEVLALGCPQFESDFAIAADAGVLAVRDSEPPGEGGADAGLDVVVDSPSSLTPDAAGVLGAADDGSSSPSDAIADAQFDAAESSASHPCPSTCDQLDANCGAVADTFCGGQIQCGTCNTGTCGGTQPSICGCPTGKLACGPACIDPMTDSTNCGKCGSSCAASSVQGEACVAGVCGCPSGTVMCFGQQANYCNPAYKTCF